MASYEIRVFGDPVLKRVAEDVSEIDGAFVDTHGVTRDSVVPDLRSKAILAIVRAIDAAVAAEGQNLMVCTTRGRGEDEAGYVIQLSMGAVDGLIAILAGDTAPMTADLDERGFPYVLLDYDDAELAGVRRALDMTASNAVRLLLERVDDASA